jgi:ubiquinone/menaquinone biosynthesis C-methylase UbiE
VSLERDAATYAKASLFHLEIASWLLALGLLLAARPRLAAASAALALAMDVAGRTWSRRTPVPMPYYMRWVLRLPRGPHAPSRLLRSLQPRPGERILEIGPGIGVHAIPVAEALRPDGVLEALDMQQPMLDELARNAARRGVSNIVTRRGDAQRLPYPDASFDAAYLVSVLGEIPDARAALRELRRVLKPDARLLVSEVIFDPDFVSLRALREQAAEAGFRFERSDGVRLGYTAVLRANAERVQVPVASPR